MFFGKVEREVGVVIPFAPLRLTYLGLAIVVLLMALLVAYTAMPESYENRRDNGVAGSRQFSILLLKQKHFLGGVAAQFLYVSAQVGSGAFFINYVTENLRSATAQHGAFLLSLALFVFTMGRFISTWLMGRVAPQRLLSNYALLSALLCLVIIMGLGISSIVALVAMFFFMSLMFPTIFALAIRGLGGSTKRGASILMMSMVGGAISPVIMGYIADSSTIRNAYVVPLACFVIIFCYGRFSKHP